MTVKFPWASIIPSISLLATLEGSVWLDYPKSRKDASSARISLNARRLLQPLDCSLMKASSPMAVGWLWSVLALLVGD